ncbi:alpha/beta-hydrolase [Lentinus tigrinus ALCF2SS1-6]|uniref:Alpha/beta-hydrolase n=1 Tax=Lentinus tigrinus ALCF2SS1-6 TaxID=1328759 RepID=A0A5C2S0X7_9APHY|nr:alpha/beta-hydrolase [Lentinus tigrinus ALCF2SS1-6]
MASPLSQLYTTATASSSQRPPHSRSSTNMNLSLPSSAAADYSAAQKRKRASQPTLPILRWFSAKQPGNTTSSNPNSPIHSRPPTPAPNPSDSPIPSSPSTPSSALSVLADAFADDPHILSAHSRGNSEDLRLPSRPEAARLPRSHNLHRPSYFSNLTRSTMPTACLSPPSPASYVRYTYTDPFEDPFSQREHDSSDLDLLLSPTPVPLPMPHSPARAHVNSSPPGVSSLDSLRSIQERSQSIHTSAPQQAFSFPQFPSLKNWFSNEESPDKENRNPMLSEEDSAETAEAEREHIRQKYAAPKNPIVFCHGLLGFDTVTLGPAIAPLQVQHWRGIRDALEANGIEILTTRVPATSSPVDRAKVLCQKIAEVYPGRAVHLIAHSMGGIDCRYLTTHLTDRPFKVLSVTTISTPHRGSSFADQFLATVGRERMPSVLSLLELLPNGGGDGKAFEFLTIENMRKFNENTPDVPGVHYFSWGAVYEPGLIDTWKWPHSVVLEKEGPNDGLVSLQSARWGTYLGTLEGVNHLDLVGWINTARYKWAEIMGREIKFKPATFYLGIADHLARVVEGQGKPESDQAKGEHGDEEEPRPGPSRETNDERQDRERGEMAESLEKGESQAGTPTPKVKDSTSTGGPGAHPTLRPPQFQRQPTKPDKPANTSRS